MSLHYISSTNLARAKNTVAGLLFASRALDKVGDEAMAAGLTAAASDLIEVIEGSLKAEVKESAPATVELISSPKTTEPDTYSMLYEFVDTVAAMKLAKGTGSAAKHTKLLQELRDVAKLLLAKADNK